VVVVGSVVVVVDPVVVDSVDDVDVPVSLRPAGAAIATAAASPSSAQTASNPPMTARARSLTPSV
jgi:hypothetical protein